MALTRLEIEPLETVIPKHIRLKSNKSLLQRMNILKQKILAKNEFGNSDSESSADSDASSNEMGQSQGGEFCADSSSPSGAAFTSGGAFGNGAFGGSNLGKGGKAANLKQSKTTTSGLQKD